MFDNEFFSFNEEKYFDALADILGVDPGYYSDDKSVLALIELIGFTREIYTEFKRQKKVICNLNSKIKALQMDNEQLQCDIVNAIQNARR